MVKRTGQTIIEKVPYLRPERNGGCKGLSEKSGREARIRSFHLRGRPTRCDGSAGSGAPPLVAVTRRLPLGPRRASLFLKRRWLVLRSLILVFFSSLIATCTHVSGPEPPNETILLGIVPLKVGYY